MHRTTILLSPRLKQVATARARAQGLAFGEFVRRAIEKSLGEQTVSRGTKQDPFWSDHAVFRGRVPRDTSWRHDAYLYGDS